MLFLYAVLSTLYNYKNFKERKPQGFGSYMNRSLTLCFFLNQTKRVILITITQINGERGQH